MRYTISKEFTFSASHQLDNLPTDHPCSRLHGHNYTVVIELTSHALDPVGFVVDYRDLAWFKEYLDANVDHRHLNDITRGNPTAERLAGWFLEDIVQWLDAQGLSDSVMASVGVSETPKTWAWCTR